MQIEFARGDSFEQGFVLKNSSTGEPVLDSFDEVYFTVKKYHTDEDYKFQKRMTTGGINYTGDGRFTVFILPEDTNGLSFGEYEFDMEFVRGTTYKRTFCGGLKLLREVTYQSNEGGESNG